MGTRKAMPVSLPLVAGQHLADGLRGAGGGGDDVDRRRAPAAPVLLGRAVDDLLRGGVAVDRGHQAGLDADPFLEQHVDDRRQAVRGAGGVRDDVVPAGSYSPSLTPITQRLHVALARRRDDDLLRARREVALGLLGVGEEARRLDHVVDAQRLPGQLARVLRRQDALHLVAADDEDVVPSTDGLLFAGGERVLEAAVDRVVLHLVREVVGVGDDVDDADDVDLLAEEALLTERLEDQATDPAEAVDPYADCHARRPPRVLIAEYEDTRRCFGEAFLPKSRPMTDTGRERCISCAKCLHEITGPDRTVRHENPGQSWCDRPIPRRSRSSEHSEYPERTSMYTSTRYAENLGGTDARQPGRLLDRADLPSPVA